MSKLHSSLSSVTRRQFIYYSALAASGAALTGYARPRPRRVSPNEKLNIAGIGAGGKGASDLRCCSEENIVALCDVNETSAAATRAKFPNAKFYKDYRVMLETVKLFPAGALGGLEFMKAVAAPYAGVKFIPTGGVDASNLKEYLSFGRVFAIGGTWIAKEAAIAEGKFEEISRLAREAVSLSLGFELAHLGINELNPPAALSAAAEFASMFSFAPREGTSSVFAGSGFEIMKNPYLGAHGHIAISCLNILRAIAYLKRKGVGMRSETAKEKDGKLIAVYLDREIAGFAIHLLSK